MPINIDYLRIDINNSMRDSRDFIMSHQSDAVEAMGSCHR